MKDNHISLFNTIAPIYGLFFNWQKKKFADGIRRGVEQFDLTVYKTILDVGSGTGSLCAALHEKGLQVTGVEPADKMLAIAKKKNKREGIPFVLGDVLMGLPFEDQSFDVVIASYVAHGLSQEERRRMYREMARIAKHKVVLYDYNQKRSLSTSLIEWLEGGDYFNFIKNAKSEMKSCIIEERECFHQVEMIHIDGRAAWYIGTIRQSE